jgi:anti-sigma factor RsiW
MLFCAKYANISLCDHIATDPAVDRRVMRGVAAAGRGVHRPASARARKPDRQIMFQVNVMKAQK